MAVVVIIGDGNGVGVDVENDWSGDSGGFSVETA